MLQLYRELITYFTFCMITCFLPRSINRNWYQVFQLYKITSASEERLKKIFIVSRNERKSDVTDSI